MVDWNKNKNVERKDVESCYLFYLLPKRRSFTMTRNKYKAVDEYEFN